jgi:hypothetical protein
MDNNINSDDSMTCALDWTPGADIKTGGTQKVSLTDLDGMDGSMPVDTKEGSVYGAEFMPVEMHTPYYEKMLTTTVEVPWLAEPEEESYMNRLKEMNEPHVQTYRELKLSPVSDNVHQTVEGFGYTDYVLFFKVLLIVFLMVFIYRLMKTMK